LKQSDTQGKCDETYYSTSPAEIEKNQKNEIRALLRLKNRMMRRMLPLRKACLLKSVQEEHAEQYEKSKKQFEAAIDTNYDNEVNGVNEKFHELNAELNINLSARANLRDKLIAEFNMMLLSLQLDTLNENNNPIDKNDHICFRGTRFGLVVTSFSEACSLMTENQEHFEKVKIVTWRPQTPDVCLRFQGSGLSLFKNLEILNINQGLGVETIPDDLWQIGSLREVIIRVKDEYELSPKVLECKKLEVLRLTGNIKVAHEVLTQLEAQGTKVTIVTGVDTSLANIVEQRGGPSYTSVNSSKNAHGVQQEKSLSEVADTLEC